MPFEEEFDSLVDCQRPAWEQRLRDARIGARKRAAARGTLRSSMYVADRQDVDLLEARHRIEELIRFSQLALDGDPVAFGDATRLFKLRACEVTERLATSWTDEVVTQFAPWPADTAPRVRELQQAISAEIAAGIADVSVAARKRSADQQLHQSTLASSAAQVSAALAAESAATWQKVAASAALVALLLSGISFVWDHYKSIIAAFIQFLR